MLSSSMDSVAVLGRGGWYSALLRTDHCKRSEILLSGLCLRIGCSNWVSIKMSFQQMSKPMVTHW